MTRLGAYLELIRELHVKGTENDTDEIYNLCFRYLAFVVLGVIINLK